MNELTAKLTELFTQLIKHPENAAAYGEELKNILNADLGNSKNFKPVICNRVFISGHNSSDPFYIAVIPVMPNKGDSIIKVDFIREYDIDIDIQNIISADNPRTALTAEELTAWIIHELEQNVLTDTNLLRYKKLLMKYYDTKNKTVLGAHNNLGYISWFGIFGNTYKDVIRESSNDPTSSNLKLLNLVSEWNKALLKFIVVSGGDPKIITNGYIERQDKIRLEQFNKLARRYCVYAVKYANRDWKTFSNYLGAEVGSECFKFYVNEEPEFIAAIPEKNEFEIFDSVKILYESVVDAIGVKDTDPMDSLTNMDIISKADEIIVDVDNVYTMSDKLLTAAKIKDLLLVIEARLEACPTDDQLQEAKERLYNATKVLETIDVSAVSELEVR